MQVLDERKRQQIHAAAARLFAARPFHEVRLEDVAAAARVGKGTLYIYFDSKEDLYVALIQDMVGALIDRLRGHAAGPDGALAKLHHMVHELVTFGHQHPDSLDLLRAAMVTKRRAEMLSKRRELASVFEEVLRNGVRNRELDDPHPELTSQFIPGMVRAAMLFGPKNVSAATLTKHIMRMVASGTRRTK